MGARLAPFVWACVAGAGWALRPRFAFVAFRSVGGFRSWLLSPFGAFASLVGWWFPVGFSWPVARPRLTRCVTIWRTIRYISSDSFMWRCFMGSSVLPSVSAVLSCLPASSLVSPAPAPFSAVCVGVAAPVSVSAFLASCGPLGVWPCRVAPFVCSCGLGERCSCPSLSLFLGAGSSACLRVWLVPPAPAPLRPALAAVVSAAAACPGLRVAVVGSRAFPALGLVSSFVGALPGSVVLVSGGAVGVDECAASCWRARGLQPVVLPFVRGVGRAGGPVRNRQLVGSVDLVVAFHDGVSTGTAGVIACARRLGVPVFVVSPPPAPGSPEQLPLF